jgi:hypothetical protein
MSSEAQAAPEETSLRRLARVWPSLLLWWFVRGLAAAVPALVLGRAAGRVLGHHESVDRALLLGGGELLFDAVAELRVEAEALGFVAVFALLLASPALAVAPGAVVLQAASPGLGLGRALGRAFTRGGSLLLSWVAALCAQALAWVLGATAFGGAREAFVSDTPQGGAVLVGLALLALAPAWTIGVFYQLARIEVALGAGPFEAAERALERLRRARARVFVGALASSLGVFACVVAGAAALELVWGGAGRGPLGALGVELAALGALSARAGFIAFALGLRPPELALPAGGAEGGRAASGGVESSDHSTRLHEDTSLE